MKPCQRRRNKAKGVIPAGKVGTGERAGAKAEKERVAQARRDAAKTKKKAASSDTSDELLNRIKRIVADMTKRENRPPQAFTSTEGVSTTNKDNEFVTYPWPANVESAMQRVAAKTADEDLVRGMKELEEAARLEGQT